MKSDTRGLRCLAVLTVVVAGLVFCSLSSAFAYSGGSGTAGDPYQIATKADLLALAAATTDYSKYFILTANINMQGQVFTRAIIAADTSSSVGFQGTAFTGTFDGNGHKITNFTINGGSNYCLGLFGYIYTGGSVKNLGLENCTVSGGSGSYYAGGLVGFNYGGSISNCYSTGVVSGYSYVGGLVGVNYYNGSISNCYSTGAVSGGYDYVGGLVGYNYGGGSIINCYSTGAVSGYYDVGGLVGQNHSSISNCYSTGVVSGSGYSVGGLVGLNSGSIINCYSTGTVSGSYYVGGLVGYNYGGGSSIINCYSMGTVSGSQYVGGLVGRNSGSVGSSFWDTQTSGQITSNGGTGKTTAQMKTLSTFTDAGWDFLGETINGTEDTWRMCVNGLYYPKLSWQFPPGDFVCPDGPDARPPVADADGPYTIYVGDTLTLDGSGSTDDDNDIVSYVWDLDDNGSFETDAGGQAIFDVNYTYLESLELLVNNTYNIHLKVTDSEGQSDVNDTTLTIVPKPALVVAVDIKPGSCPNPLNVKSSGVLPVAILGTADYDVTTIDPTSIRLAGVEPLRSGYEDVAAPLPDTNDCNCTTAGPDGYLDLTLKFQTQEIVEAIGEVNDGDVLTLELTGVLLGERPIEGADCILIRGRHKPFNEADINKDGVVNNIDFAVMAENWLDGI